MLRYCRSRPSWLWPYLSKGERQAYCTVYCHKCSHLHIGRAYKRSCLCTPPRVWHLFGVYPACFENNLCGSMFHLRHKSKTKWCNFISSFQRRINSFNAEIIPHISRSLWKKRHGDIFDKGGILRHQRKYINRLKIMKKGECRYVTFTSKVSF